MRKVSYYRKSIKYIGKPRRDDITISPLRGYEASDNLFFYNNDSPSGFSDLLPRKIPESPANPDYQSGCNPNFVNHFCFFENIF
ncbi:MAG: hypothetical protein BWK80_15605 [Desulfobacteraceae bacterium IS3]|nr:MAG: hypothetical protein BWK80_15605 [Desulfobacteraceae bacterium IS3]